MERQSLQYAERLIQRMGSSSMKHCQATLLWLARRDLGAVLWTANADLILHRIQHLGGLLANVPASVTLSTGSSRRATRRHLGSPQRAAGFDGPARSAWRHGLLARLTRAAHSLRSAQSAQLTGSARSPGFDGHADARRWRYTGTIGDF